MLFLTYGLNFKNKVYRIRLEVDREQFAALLRGGRERKRKNDAE